MALLSPPPKMQFFGNDGLPLSGGKIYTYAKDTLTPLATYTDSTGSSANTNPIILDAQGRANIWLQILPYSFVIYSSLDVLQSCSGPIEFPSAALSGSDIPAWSDIVVYNFPDQVAGSDGYTYRCVGTNVLDDDPVGSETGNWVNLSSLASAALTGTPTAPTAAEGTNTTQIATCAFVQTAANRAGGRNRDIIGGDATASGNILTYSICMCWDSTGLIWLESTAPKTVTLPSAANTMYHIYLVRLVADSSVEIRQYATTAAVAEDAEINAYRRIDYWLTNGSNAARAGITVNGVKWWSRFAENALFSLTTPPANITTEIDLSAFIPDNFYSEVLLGSQAGGVGYGITFVGGVSGTAQAKLTGNSAYNAAGQGDEWIVSTHSQNGFIPIITNSYFWGRSYFADEGQTVTHAVHAVKLRR